jgi:Domain of Unknown Function (DUF1080)
MCSRSFRGEGYGLSDILNVGNFSLLPEGQIDDLGAPDGAAIHKTGAIYGVQPPLLAASRTPGEWNAFVICAVGQIYNVTLNGQRVIVDFLGTRLRRGFIGLQNHGVSDVVYFRNMQVVPL